MGKLFLFAAIIIAFFNGCNVAPEEPAAETEFYSDGEVLTLNRHTHGNGIPIVIIGEGFNHEDLRHGGNWEKVASTLNDIFLKLDVFKDFGEYFDVYAYMAESQDRGVASGSHTKFGTNGSLSNTNHALARELIRSMPQIGDINRVSTMFIYNGNMGIGTTSTAKLEDDGYGYAAYSSAETNAKYWCAHEFGGHVFGWLIDEICSGSLPDEAFATFAARLTYDQSLGKYLNVALTKDKAQVPWSRFFDIPGYDPGTYPGGYYICNGIWRSESASVMTGPNYPHYNAQSRYLIYKRIKDLAGESFTFDDFRKYDAGNLFQN